jgi:hypothetical protein
MARKKKINFWRRTLLGFWLMWSMSGGILFSFGVLDWLNGEGTLLPVGIGAIIILVAILTNKFTTETALAMKIKK